MNFPYKTKEYKYKVNESIVYTDFRYDEKECECCHNTEEDRVEFEVRASIKSRKRTNPDSYCSPPMYMIEELVSTKIINGKPTTVSEPKLIDLEEQQAKKRMYNEYTLSNGTVKLESEL